MYIEILQFTPEKLYNSSNRNIEINQFLIQCRHFQYWQWKSFGDTHWKYKTNFELNSIPKTFTNKNNKVRIFPDTEKLGISMAGIVDKTFLRKFDPTWQYEPDRVLTFPVLAKIENDDCAKNITRFSVENSPGQRFLRYKNNFVPCLG